jgi:Cd2+/Zn2+-exporting ATPase
MSQARFHVPKMDCATEKEVIGRRLASVGGIERIDFDLIERVVIVTHGPAGDVPAAVEFALIDIDMAPTRVASSVPGAPAAAGAGLPAAPDGRRLEYALLAVSGAASIGAEIVAWTTGRESSIAVIVLAALGLATGGPKTLRKGIVAARTLTLNINLLMLIAVAGALAIQQWPEAAMVTFLFACAEVIEARSVDRARDAIRSLMVLAPDLTRVRAADGTWSEVDTTTITPGATIQIRPGERLPLDGKIIAGKTSIDQAPITGESIPVDKAPGDAGLRRAR